MISLHIIYHGRGRRPQNDGVEKERQLFRFMTDVLIPVAERTSALVLVEAVKSHCMLAYAFSEALASVRAK